jgi:hypothetical protein
MVIGPLVLEVEDAHNMDFKHLGDLAGSVSFSHIAMTVNVTNHIDQEKTAFGMPGMGHFEYNRSAQGLCYSPSAFQRLLDHVTAGLKGVYVYIDDVVVVSKDYEGHKRQLDKLFQQFQEYGLKCRLSKLQLAAEEVNYLGYIISQKNGIRAGESKSQAIKKWEALTDITLIKQFLGLCSFFQRTIKDFAKLSSPLTRLTRKDSVWKC